MGIIPRRGFPCVWTPTTRFRMAVDAIAFRCSALCLSRVLFTVRLLEARLTIRTRPLMGSTYSRLGATLGSPKLRLLSSSVSFVSLSCFIPLPPLYSSCSPAGYLSNRSSSPACCCVPRLSQLLRDLALRLHHPPLRLPGLQGIAPLPRNDPVAPVSLKLDNTHNSRYALMWGFCLGGDIRRNFLNPSATTEYVEKTRH